MEMLANKSSVAAVGAVERFFNDRDEWLSWRRGGIGSSDALALAVAAGLCTAPKWLKPGADQHLFWEKIGMGAPNKVNSAMRRGTEMEEGVRQEMEGRFGFLAPANMENVRFPWLRASIDGLTMDNAIVEIKVPNQEVIDAAYRGEVVDYYQPQLAHQLMALFGHPDEWSGDEEWHFAAHDAQAGKTPLVSGKSRVFVPLACKLFELEQEAWSRVEDMCPIGGDEWFSLSKDIALLKARVTQDGKIRDRLINAVLSGYTPTLFKAVKTKPGERRVVDWTGAFAAAGMDFQDMKGRLPRGDLVWTHSGGAGAQADEADDPVDGASAEEDALDASEYLALESAYADALKTKAMLDNKLAQAYELALDMDDMAIALDGLCGPYGLRVYQRSGAPKVELATFASKHGVPESVIAAHTSVVQTNASVRLTLL